MDSADGGDRPIEDWKAIQLTGSKDGLGEEC
jgi:hypothetical protein